MNELRTQNVSRKAKASGFRLKWRARLAPYPTPLRAAGFTLIELSIVLVIIGLIVGGVLVGKDLIEASKLRTTISQIESYRTATNTFKLKYDSLPGDMKGAKATRSGFQTRFGDFGRGDGNGILQMALAFNSNYGTNAAGGENALFWRDLSQAGLIGESFTIATDSIGPASSDPTLLFPVPKIAGGNGLFAWSGGPGKPSDGTGSDGKNYFGIARPAATTTQVFQSFPALTVAQAHAIDKKTDDAKPQSGRVLSLHPYSGTGIWAVGGPFGYFGGPDPGSAAAINANSCYDNNNNAAQISEYSVAANATAYNCSLSFRF